MAHIIVHQKSCPTCEQDKSSDCFYNNRSKVDGLSTQCKTCVGNQIKTPQAKANRRRFEQRQRAKDPDRYRGWAFKRKYGITIDDYDALFVSQGGRCGICGEAPAGRPLVVDHDHKTRKIRGLLCAKCNTALGVLGDTAEGLTRAVKYLQASA